MLGMQIVEMIQFLIMLSYKGLSYYKNNKSYTNEYNIKRDIFCRDRKGSTPNTR